MKRIICAVLSMLALLLVDPVFAGTLSGGKSAKDKQVAARICKVLDGPHVLMVSVQESILYVDIARTFYNEMLMDRLSAHQLIKVWLTGMRKESGKEVVTVWVYVDKIKVVEGKTSWTGEDKITFISL